MIESGEPDIFSGQKGPMVNNGSRESERNPRLKHDFSGNPTYNPVGVIIT